MAATSLDCAEPSSAANVYLSPQATVSMTRPGSLP
jgi:hypothetical protein